MQSLSTISEKLQIALMPIHCLSEQQLLQYVEQRMPEVEQHLVEQHLVDCPLCSAAVEMLQHSDDKRPALQSIAQNVRNYLQAQYFPAPAESPAAADLQKARLLTRERKRETLSKYVWGLVFIGTAFGGVLWLNSHTEMPPRVAASASGQHLPVSPDKAALELTNAAPASFISSNEHKLVRQTVYTTQTQAAEKTTEPSDITGAASLTEPVSLLNDSTEKTHLTERAGTVSRSIAVPDSGLNNKKKTDTLRHSTPAPSEPLQKRPLSAVPQGKDQEKEAVAALHAESAGEVTGSAASRGGDEVRYTTAKKLMQQGNWDEALSRLKDLSEEPGNRFYEMARYQSALCYKALGKKGKSRKMLKALIHENGPMKEQAAQQLSSL